MTDQELIRQLRQNSEAEDHRGAGGILREAADRLAELTTLRPMSEAPRDGTDILVKYKDIKPGDFFFRVSFYCGDHPSLFLSGRRPGVCSAAQALGWLPLPAAANPESQVSGGGAG